MRKECSFIPNQIKPPHYRLPFQHEFDANPRLRNRRRVWKEFIENDNNRPDIKLYDSFDDTKRRVIIGVIEQCWKTNPNDRPSMDDILIALNK